MFAPPPPVGVVATPTTVNFVPDTVNVEPTFKPCCEAYPESTTATSAFASAAPRLRPAVMDTVDSGPIAPCAGSTPSRVVGWTPTFAPAVGPGAGPAYFWMTPGAVLVPWDSS